LSQSGIKRQKMSVRFNQQPVAEVRTRPRTRLDELPYLYFGEHEYSRFCEEAAAEQFSSDMMVM
jgi:hypothetical protein